MNYLKFIQENKNYFEDFITRSTYHSNAIEGSTLSVNETYALLFNAKHCMIENANPREIHEAINHKDILTTLLNKLDNHERLSRDLLLLINQTINKNIIYVGGYRMDPIRIIGSEKSFPLPNQLDDLMNDFIVYYNNLVNKDISMSDVANMHLQYENIHPFPDGNGRTGRLLINYLLLLKNECPIVIPVAQRKKYLELMEDNDIDGLSIFFQQLQQEELKRIQDFKEML